MLVMEMNELGFFELNAYTLLIIACFLIVRFENIYLRVVLYAIAYMNEMIYSQNNQRLNW